MLTHAAPLPLSRATIRLASSKEYTSQQRDYATSFKLGGIGLLCAAWTAARSFKPTVPSSTTSSPALVRRPRISAGLKLQLASMTDHRATPRFNDLGAFCTLAHTNRGASWIFPERKLLGEG